MYHGTMTAVSTLLTNSLYMKIEGKPENETLYQRLYYNISKSEKLIQKRYKTEAITYFPHLIT